MHGDCMTTCCSRGWSGAAIGEGFEGPVAPWCPSCFGQQGRESSPAEDQGNRSQVPRGARTWLLGEERIVGVASLVPLAPGSRLRRALPAVLEPLPDQELPAVAGDVVRARRLARAALPGQLQRIAAAAGGERRPGRERDLAPAGGQRLVGPLLSTQQQERSVA